MHAKTRWTLACIFLTPTIHGTSVLLRCKLNCLNWYRIVPEYVLYMNAVAHNYQIERICELWNICELGLYGLL